MVLIRSLFVIASTLGLDSFDSGTTLPKMVELIGGSDIYTTSMGIYELKQSAKKKKFKHVTYYTQKNGKYLLYRGSNRNWMVVNNLNDMLFDKATLFSQERKVSPVDSTWMFFKDEWSIDFDIKCRIYEDSRPSVASSIQSSSYEPLKDIESYPSKVVLRGGLAHAEPCMGIYEIQLTGKKEPFKNILYYTQIDGGHYLYKGSNKNWMIVNVDNDMLHNRATIYSTDKKDLPMDQTWMVFADEKWTLDTDIECSIYSDQGIDERFDQGTNQGSDQENEIHPILQNEILTLKRKLESQRDETQEYIQANKDLLLDKEKQAKKTERANQRSMKESEEYDLEIEKLTQQKKLLEQALKDASTNEGDRFKNVLILLTFLGLVVESLYILMTNKKLRTFHSKDHII